jgi:hypothetical protein
MVVLPGCLGFRGAGGSVPQAVAVLLVVLGLGLGLVEGEERPGRRSLGRLGSFMSFFAVSRPRLFWISVGVLMGFGVGLSVIKGHCVRHSVVLLC